MQNSKVFKIIILSSAVITIGLIGTYFYLLKKVKSALSIKLLNFKIKNYSHPALNTELEVAITNDLNLGFYVLEAELYLIQRNNDGEKVISEINQQFEENTYVPAKGFAKIAISPKFNIPEIISTISQNLNLNLKINGHIVVKNKVTFKVPIKDYSLNTSIINEFIQKIRQFNQRAKLTTSNTV
jgi:hypothetical protein